MVERSSFGKGTVASTGRLRRLAMALLVLCLWLGPARAPAGPDASLDALHGALEALGREQPGSPGSAVAISEAIEIVRARQQALAALAEREPARVLALAIAPEVRERLPAVIRAELERPVELEGEVTVLYEDGPGRARLRHFLVTHGVRRSLHFAEARPELTTGERIRVRGVEVPLRDGSSHGAVVAACCEFDGVLALAGGNGKGKGGGESDGEAAPPAPQSTGERRVLTMLVNFVDDPREPQTVAEAETVVFGETGDFVLENSYGQTWLVGDVAGWFTLPLTGADCDLFAIASHAKSAAAAAGYDPAGYQHHVYVFPRGGCTGRGAGTVGGSPSEAWIIETLDLKVLSHELGHNLGLHHARALDCGAEVLGNDCTVFEYGDRIDTMGNVAAGHYNAFHKDLLGWFDAAGAPFVTEALADGVYTLQPLELAGDAAGALAIPRSVDPATGEASWYYVEYRRPLGFDAFLAGNENVANGVIVHLGSPENANSSQQLDMTPDSGLQNWSDWSDPALEVGRSFHDPDSGVTITPLSADATAAEVSVRFGAPLPAPGEGGGELAVTVATDRSVYGWKQTAELTAGVALDGVPTAGASVSFRIIDPDGRATVRSATTGADGTASVSERFHRRDSRGRYEVRVETWADPDLVAEASTSFVLD